MAHRLGQHTLSSVYHDYCQVSSRGPGRHIARILFMPGRISHNEFPLGSGKEPIGHINRDALFTFRLQPINKQGVVYFPMLGPNPLAFRFQGGQLILHDQFGIPQ